MLAVLVGFLLILIPSLVENIVSLFQAFPSYLKEINKTIGSLANALQLDPEFAESITVSWKQLVELLQDDIYSLASNIANLGITLTISILSGVANAIIAIVSSIYLMLSKEKLISQFKKLLFAVFPKKFTNNLIRVTRNSNDIFTGFISGKLLESLIIGILTFIAMTVIGLDYALLISVIMAVCNIIPFFGPFIGAIPSAFLLLMVSPLDALWFVIVTIVLQQINGQLISPRILGKSTGLTPFWVIFAIIAGGGFGGLLGMILGIPVFAVFYSLIVEFTNSRLKKRGLPTKSSDRSEEPSCRERV